MWLRDDLPSEVSQALHRLIASKHTRQSLCRNLASLPVLSLTEPMAHAQPAPSRTALAVCENATPGLPNATGDEPESGMSLISLFEAKNRRFKS